MIRADGRTSWFSDSTTASGDNRTPGIAVWNRHTLGGFWWVRYPNARSPILKQIDMGPDPSLNRTVDTHQNALHAAGYGTGNYPTDARVQAVFLGRGANHAVRQANRLGLRVTPGGAVQPQPGLRHAMEHTALAPSAVVNTGSTPSTAAAPSGLRTAMAGIPNVTLPTPPATSQSGLEAALRRAKLI